MPHFRALAIDVDGTLVNSRDELTFATKSALKRASEAGIQIILATGRRYSRVLPLVKELDLQFPVVTASGALIKDPRDHGTLFRASFGETSLKRTLEVVAEKGYEAVLYADTFLHGFDFYCPSLCSSQEAMADYLAQNPGCGRASRSLMQDPPEGVFAGFAAGSKEAMLKLADDLHAALPEELYLHVLRSPRYLGYFCEIAPVGVTKWSSVRWLTNSLGIIPQEICAVGDDVNDIPMIAEAGLGVAMGNALPEVKEVADRIAPTHDQDGLAQVVDWLLA